MKRNLRRIAIVVAIMAVAVAVSGMINMSVPHHFQPLSLSVTSGLCMLVGFVGVGWLINHWSD